MIDLTRPENQEAVDELANMEELGEFVLKVLEIAKAEKKELMFDGFGTGNFRVKYNGEIVDIRLNMSVDPGDDPIDNWGYSMSIKDLRKPWVKKAIGNVADQKKMELRSITFKQFCLDAAGETLDLSDLEEQYPKLTYSDFLTAIGEEIGRLGTNFYYRPLPNREAFYMDFADKEMERKYIDNDPEFEATFGPVVKEMINAVHKKLKTLNEKKAA